MLCVIFLLFFQILLYQYTLELFALVEDYPTSRCLDCPVSFLPFEMPNFRKNVDNP